MKKEKTEKGRLKRTVKYLNTVKAIFFITLVINIFLFAYKHESKVEHSNYKVLVQETEGSDNYVEYSGISFPKSGYVLAGSTCKNGGVITQNAAKTLSFTGGVDECTLKFDIAGETYTENSLYGVIANEYNNGGLAGKYTGEHADAYDRSGTKNIYYFTTPTADDETQGNELLDKWNVIFGGFCWQMLRTTDTGGVKMIYNGVPTNGQCNNSGEAQQVGTSHFNTNYNSPAYVGYMYNTVYKYQTQTAGAYKYGNSFTYSNGTYTLTDTITTSSNAAANDLNNHHYTCFNTSGTCSSISYIYYLSSSTAYYITLSNGKSVENALNEMLTSSNVNTNNSTIKTYIDNWYQSNLSSYTNYLEDSVFCNDRSIQSLNGWNPNGGSVTSYLQFKEYTTTSDLSCINNTDRFSTLNNSARLTYPIGLASNPEMNLLNNSTSRNTGQFYWLASPSSFRLGNRARERYVNTTGGLNGNYVDAAYGARPVVSVRPGTEYSSGDGTRNSPYIIDTSPSTMSFDKLKSLNSSISLNSTTPNFGETAIEDEGIFKADDDYGTSYYWRGAATTNYIQFGKNSSNQNLYWRIIRINGDGSLRLLYDGTAPGQASSIGTNVYNNASGRDVYIGYMHSGMGISSNTNTNSSAVKQVIDSWYENNIKNKSFESNISDNLFCNDRSISSSNLPNLYTSGYYTYFSAYDRIYHNNPILTCPQKNDAFTVSDTTFGNGNLTYPIGLISADEYFMTNLNLGNSSNTWTMSPQAYCESGTNLISHYVWQYLLSNNQLNSLENTSSANISPVINLKSSVINSITGTGTSTDPFVVH